VQGPSPNPCCQLYVKAKNQEIQQFSGSNTDYKSSEPLKTLVMLCNLNPMHEICQMSSSPRARNQLLFWSILFRKSGNCLHDERSRYKKIHI